MISAFGHLNNYYPPFVVKPRLLKTNDTNNNNQEMNSEQLVENLPQTPIVFGRRNLPWENSLVKYLEEYEETQKEQKKQETEKNKGIKVEKKDSLEKTAELLTRDYITKKLKNHSLLKDITKVTPTTLVLAILGVDMTKDGKVIADSVKTGKGGNYKESFKELIKSYDEAIAKAQEDGTWESIKVGFQEAFGFVPTCGSVIVTNTLAYVGNCFADVLGESGVVLAGSSLEVAGTMLDSIGGSVINVLSGTFGSITSLFKGDTKGALDSLKNMGKKFKETGKTILNSFEDCAKVIEDYANPKTRMEKKVSRWRKLLERIGILKKDEEEKELSPEELEKIMNEALELSDQITKSFENIFNPDKKQKTPLEEIGEEIQKHPERYKIIC